MGIVKSTQWTLQKYGIRGMYQGASSILFFNIPWIATRFASFEFFKNYVFTERNRLNTFLCGLGAGITECLLVVCPMETIKIQLIHDKLQPQPKYKGLFHGIYKITKKEGMFGAYKGLTPNLLKSGSNQAIRFVTFDETKRFLHANTESIPEPIIKFAAGTVAAVTSVLANNPIDTIKSRMQGLQSKQYDGFLHCMKKTIKDEGFLSLYSGIRPRLISTIIHVTLVLSMYDYLSELILRFWPDDEKKHQPVKQKSEV